MYETTALRRIEEQAEEREHSERRVWVKHSLLIV